MNTFYNPTETPYSRGVTRPYIEDPQVSDYWVDSEQGNNGNSGLAEDAAFAEMKAAYLKTGFGDTSNTRINLVYRDTPYELDFGIFGANFVDIVGQPDVEETYDILSVGTISANSGVEFTLDVSPALANDVLKGRILYLNGQLGDLRQILVTSNVGNVVYGVMNRREGFFDSDQLSFSASGATVDLMRFPEVNIVNSNYFIGSIQFDLFYCKVTGGQIFAPATGKTVFAFCQVENTSFATSRGGAIYFLSSAVNLKGVSGSSAPSIRAAANGEMRLGQGSIFTNANDETSFGQYIEVRSSATLNLTGGCKFSGLTGDGILCNGGRVFETSPNNPGDLTVVFDDDNSDVKNTKGFVFNQYDPAVFNSPDANGGASAIPECHGTIDADYFVEAQRGAYVEINESSSVTTNLGTNTVSADGGTSNVAIAPDGTRIYGGAPTIPAFTNSGPLSTDVTAVGNVGTGEDDLITYTLPANTLFSDGDHIEIETCGVAQSTQTFKLYLGSTAILDHTFSGGSPKDFKVEAIIIKDGTGSQKAIASLVDGGGSNIETTYTDVAEDETTALTIKGTGEGTSNDDIVQEFMIVKWGAAS